MASEVEGVWALPKLSTVVVVHAANAKVDPEATTTSAVARTVMARLKELLTHDHDAAAFSGWAFPNAWTKSS
jgi:hypothetical protein